MLNNKFLIIISVLAAAAVVYVTLKIEKKSRKLPPVINAVPAEVSYFIETEDFYYFLNKISKNEDLKDILSKNKITEKTFNDILFIDTLFHQKKDLKKFFSSKKVIIAANPTRQNKNEFLFLSGASDIDETYFENILNEIDSVSETTKSGFAGAVIKHRYFPESKIKIHYSFYEHYFLLSRSEILIQKSIKNINGNVGLAQDIEFKKLYEKTQTDDAGLFVNYETLFSNTGKIFNGDFGQTLKLLKNTANWSAFNISVKRKRIKLTGHTCLKPEMQFLSVFKDNKPRKSKVLSIFPEKTAFFLILNIKNGSDFKYKYEDFLAKQKELNDFQIKLADFYKTYKISEDENDLYSITTDEIALIKEDIDKTGKNLRNYFFININDYKKSKKFFRKIASVYAKKKAQDISNFVFPYNTEENNYTIYKLSEKNIPELFYGTLFKAENFGYCVLSNDFAVFGESFFDLKELINSIEKDKTFKRKSPNYEFVKSLPDESNVNFYIDLFHASGVIENNLSKNLAAEYDKNVNSLSRVQGPVIQYIFDSYPVYTIVDIGLNSLTREISETIWEVRLDTLVASKPYIVKNHNTDEKEIIIQDIKNKIYLIDKSGKLLWTRQLDGKILSNIYQIDYYENNKLQYLFNTESKIYCIDRNGNWLDGYPIKLKSKATNGISVFDYDQNRNYRIFVAGSNKSVYLLDKNGEYINGWTFDKTESYVSYSVKHFKNADKDYIVFRDLNNLYILNRRGEQRVTPEVNIPLSKNNEVWFTEDNPEDKAHFCVSNPAGTIYFIYEDGKVQKNTFKTYTRNHFFVYKDINGDDIPEFIFTDKNQTDVYDGKSKERLFSYSYDEDIKNNISVYEFGDNDFRLGTCSDNKLYLINNEGKLCKGFPLTGTGLFSITVFDNKPEFSLITGNKDNYLYKYQIK